MLRGADHVGLRRRGCAVHAQRRLRDRALACGLLTFFSAVYLLFVSSRLRGSQSPLDGGA